jgi:hypothetical protein
VDFFGPINPPTKRSITKYIITVTDYLTRRVKVEPFRDCSVEKTTLFLFENVVTRFGCRRVLMSDQGTHFLNMTIATLVEEFHIHHKKST